MIAFKEITLSQKKLFDEYLQVAQFENSELTFTNLFIWREPLSIRYCMMDHVLYIMAIGLDGRPFYLIPLSKKNNADYLCSISILVEDAKKKMQPFLMRGVPEKAVEQLEREFSKKLIFEADQDNFDYVYQAQDLRDLAGRKYHSKRNHVNQFLSLYAYECGPLLPENKDECEQLFENWLSQKEDDGMEKAESRVADYERCAFLEAINHMDALGLLGCVIRIDGKVQAFSMGEITPYGALIHMEKANRDYQGLFAFINQICAKNAFPESRYINREEDMGYPGLRKAKKSYYPDHMVKKYNVYLSEEK